MSYYIKIESPAQVSATMGNSASTTATPTSDAAALVALARLHPELHTMLRSTAPASTIKDMYAQLYADKPKQEIIRGAIRTTAITRGDYDLFEMFAEPLTDTYIADPSINAEFRLRRLRALKHAHVMTILRSTVDNKEMFSSIMAASMSSVTPAEHQELARAVTFESTIYGPGCILFAATVKESQEIAATIAAERAAKAAAIPESLKVAAEVTVEVAGAVQEAAAAVETAAVATESAAAEVAQDAGEAKAFAEDILQQ